MVNCLLIPPTSWMFFGQHSSFQHDFGEASKPEEFNGPTDLGNFQLNVINPKNLQFGQLLGCFYIHFWQDWGQVQSQI